MTEVENQDTYVLASVDADGSVRAMTLFEGEDPREIGETLVEHGSVPGRQLRLMTYAAFVTARMEEASHNGTFYVDLRNHPASG